MLVPVEKIRQTHDRLMNQLKEYAARPEVQHYFKVMNLFPAYDADTTLRIIMKCPKATVVLSRKEWKMLGRKPRPGAVPIKVRAPKMINGVMQMSQRSLYDISDTEGKELPLLKCRLLDQTVPNEKQLWYALVSAAPCPVLLEPMEADMNGFYDSSTDTISVNANIPAASKLKTLAHECAHGILHSVLSLGEVDRRVIETVAESVAYMVCAHFSLDTSSYSLSYITAWGNNQLKECLNDDQLRLIRTTAATIVERVERQLYETDFLFRANELAQRYAVMMTEFGYGEIPNVETVLHDFINGRNIEDYIGNLRSLHMDLFANTLIDDLQRINERTDPLQNMTARILLYQDEYAPYMNRSLTREEVETYLKEGDAGFQKLEEALPRELELLLSSVGPQDRQLLKLLENDIQIFQTEIKNNERTHNYEKDDHLQRGNGFYR